MHTTAPERSGPAIPTELPRIAVLQAAAVTFGACLNDGPIAIHLTM